ncbi:hypothetical protein [Actinoplanes awajinensis]|uniref:Uncharacterized protein n=1 Tax=Actinoplanes awajinensis subsp. mycoplanecinus TaxID=135947 RepID=A0A0X3V786_9ACTN|nr:hypothetical protein [Actinoplanes awajinensis]KUL40538.1 hypothetical protein ADL15_07095 [Actinoplanes awajinensis subsp. mycoplanecinus]
MPNDPIDRLAEVLGDVAASGLRRSATLRHRRVDLAEPRWVARGYSGAVLVAVVERSLPPAPHVPSKYVVKLCPADGRQREASRHHAAWQLSPQGFADRHLVQVAGDPIGLPDGGVLLLQNIAGDTLTGCRPMSEFPASERLLIAAAVVRALTAEWTAASEVRLDELTVAGFLHDGLDGTSTSGLPDPALRFGVDPHLLDDDCGWMETAEDGPLVNPFALLDGRGPVAEQRVQFIAGRTHGDLHEDNILAPRVDGAADAGNFRLVDLSTFEEAGPLSRDLAMLTVSSVVRRMGELSPGQKEALLHYLSGRALTGVVPDGIFAFVDTVRHAARPDVVTAEFEQNWSEQLLLSLAAAALLHLSFGNVDADTRWWLLRLAAQAATRFLRSRGTAVPDERRPIDQNAVTAVPRATRPDDRSPNTGWPAAVSDGLRRRLVLVAPDTTGNPELGAALHDVARAFATVGYHCPGGVTTIGDPDDTRDAIAAQLMLAGPDDAVAVYLLAEIQHLDPGAGGQPALGIRTARSRPGRARGTLALEALLEGLREAPEGARTRNLLLVMDVAGAEPNEVMQAATAMVARLASGGPGSMHVVAAVRPAGSPLHGFAAVWSRTLTGYGDAPRDQPYLELDGLADRLRRAAPAATVLGTASMSAVGPNLCLPNPRHHLTGVDPAEMMSWWEPTARATASQSGDWFFSGRRRLNTRIVHWLADAADPVLVLTGAPGSGKSTVLARMVAATVPDIREQLRGRPGALRPAETPPPDFRFALTMRLTKRGVEDIHDHVAQILNAQDGGPMPPVIALDGLDEADDPHLLVATVLRPLVQQARAGGPRLLIATRSHPVGHDPTDAHEPRTDLIGPLISDGGSVIDVGTTPWLQTGDIAEYCDRLLSVATNDRGRTNIYAALPRARRVLARSIETQARHSFLLAAHVARRHTLDTSATDSQSPAWRRQFPQGIGDAMRQEINALYGVDEADRQMALLRPLAFAHGAGLTRTAVGDDLWALLATRLDSDRRTFTEADVTDLLSQRVATHLVVEVDSGRERAYRFHHEALAAAVVDDYGDRAAAHRSITEALLDSLVTGGARNWQRASAYVRRALPAHAGEAGTLGALIEDSRVLMYCDPDRLHEALITSGTTPLISLSHLLRPYLHRLHSAPAPARGFLLSVAATVTDRQPLAASLAAAAGMPVTVDHVQVRHEALRQSIAEGQPVAALHATSTRHGQPLIFVANGTFLDVRDPDTGALVDTVLSGSTDVSGLAGYLDDDGFPVVAAAGSDGGVRVWDVTTRALRGESPVDFRGGIVHGLAGAGEPFLAGWTEEHVGIWHPGQPGDVRVLPVRWDPGRQPITAAAVTRDQDGRDLLAVAAGGQVTVWDPDTGGLRHTIDLGLAFNITLACLQPGRDDGLLLITTGLHEREAQLWQPSTGSRPWPFAQVPICTGSWAGPAGYGIAFGYASGAVEAWDGVESHPPRRLLDAGMTIHAVTVGPAGTNSPIVVSIDTLGQIRVWPWDRGRNTMSLSGSTPRAVATGLLRHGGRYLAVGRNNGADLWRLDEVSQHSSAAGLHEADAQRIDADPASSRFVTVGDDGRAHIWSTRSGRFLGAASIPSGGPFAVAGWHGRDGYRIAVTAASVLQIIDPDDPGKAPWTREMGSPGTIAILEHASDVLLAVADRQQIHLVDPATATVSTLHVPETAPGREHLSAAARNVVRLTWIHAPGADPLLVAGTQGGVLVRWSCHEDGQMQLLQPSINHPGIVTVLTPVPGGDGGRVLAGSPTGTLLVYNIADGSIVHDLTKDDARIVAATVVDTSPPVLVTAHLADNASGLRIWNPLTGRQQRSVVHRSDPAATYVGVPRAGRTASGRVFIVYDVEDGAELLWLNGPAYDDDPVRLLLPFTLNDVTVDDDLIFIAGGGGFLTLTVGRHDGTPP